MYKIMLRRKAQRSLDKLPKNDYALVLHRLMDLAYEPRPIWVEKIRIVGLWRVRQGDYRVIYDIDDDQRIVVILYIGHRKDIYRSL